MKSKSLKFARTLPVWTFMPAFLSACSGTALSVPPSYGGSGSYGSAVANLDSPLTKTSRWSVVASPNVILYPGFPDDALYSVKGSSPKDVWAVGASCCTAYGSQEYSKSLIEHWDGSSWKIASPPLQEPADSQLRGVAAITPEDAWAVGYSVFPNQALIEHWDGKKWSVASSPSLPSSSLDAIVALSATDIWAVGSANGSPLAEHWDGKSWSVIPTQAQSGGASGFWSVAAVASNDVWAVGEYSHPNGNALAEHWDGTRWTQVRVGGKLPISVLSGVTAVASNDVWAVGYVTVSKLNGTPQTLVEHWDGKRWNRIPSPNMEPKHGYQLANWLFGVTASSPNDVWAVGFWTWYPGSGTTRSLFERWNGVVWKTAPGPSALESSNNLAFNQLFGITTIRPRLLWAVGTFFLDSQSEYGDTTLTVNTTRG